MSAGRPRYDRHRHHPRRARSARRAQVVRRPPGPGRGRPDRAARRGHGDPRPVRLREVHPAAGHQPPGEAGDRLRQRQRRTHRRPSAGRAAQGAQRARHRNQRSRIGFVFQNFTHFPHLTVLDNVAAAPVATGKLGKADARELARELLGRVGLGDRTGAYPRQLSGGQQQRVAIARALALRPGVILFDEPTSALDPELVGEVLAVIKDLATSGTTLVIVTHEIGFAREIADRVVFIDGGRVVEQGPPSEVLDRPRHERTRDFLSKVL
ncbi:ectoine/hydroxyectoine ABC transporter, ATP-binding protein [Streptomyces sviceus ATCC 29083]|uniref:Ectoine/hydroxyectoine ABC transporter, ATP-binding protein n=1 Tax=Streptomyces sviceus (strain ATCC 29083 / DSM 924 / JCM 4929 / NBRC 13980 / NCIMB 11184 / NRRL 5439 / UC 5370) TaxID=463191 RepID=D6XB69_STRX2|nr:ectoine/hydroxyectoine ABC transporter, ATP-binding protein [Streptomyces sviceus ATCC 29083]